jgi:hypothetical protein
MPGIEVFSCWLGTNLFDGESFTLSETLSKLSNEEGIFVGL